MVRIQVSGQDWINMPNMGFGTYEIAPEDTYLAVKEALHSGYRMIDTAEVYRNEEEVGKAIRDSGISRDQIFLISKVHPKHMKIPNGVYEAALFSLKRLGLSYLDQYLIHWPGVSGISVKSQLLSKYRKTSWQNLERLYFEGKCKSIGVSNFEIRHLQDLEKFRIQPCVNQVEVHPLFIPNEVISYCQSKCIQIVAYSSLARGSHDLLGHPKVSSISRKYECSPAQVALSWSISKGFVVIPKTLSKKRLKENLESANVHLSVKDVEALDGLSIHQMKTCWDPSTVQ